MLSAMVQAAAIQQPLTAVLRVWVTASQSPRHAARSAHWDACQTILLGLPWCCGVCGVCGACGVPLFVSRQLINSAIAEQR